MVVLSTTLPARAARAANLAVAGVYVLVSAGNVLGESWTYYYGVAIALELAVLALVVRLAWTWPRTSAAPLTAPAVSSRSMQQA